MAIFDGLFRGRDHQARVDDNDAKKSQFTVSSHSVPSTGSTTPSSGLATPTEEKGLSPLGPVPEIGRLGSWKGALVLLVTSGSQFLDNVFMTSANVALSSIQEDFNVSATNLQWMISAYTLTFGGFLLLAGVLSDRYGRKLILCLGLTWLSIWTLAIGFGQSFIQLTVFRGLQGIGAALTVPSAIGIISAYFTGLDRTRALSIYASSGTVGFCVGLIFGGFLTSSLGWRYIFYFIVIITGALGILGFIVLPADNMAGKAKPKMDYVGAMLSTAGLILLQFVLSSGGVYGWGTPFIIVLLILAVALLASFVVLEKFISCPLMPLSLWKLPNFAGLWVAGFTCYGSYQNVIYYIVLMAQEVDHLSAGDTALRFLPMGVIGFIASMGTGKALEYVNGKYTLLAGLILTVLAPVPSAITASPETSFWVNVLPTSLISITAVSLIFVTTSTAILTTVPVNVKSLCGGMLNTAFQIGSGVALAISAAVTETVDIKKGHGLAEQYATGLWCSAGLAGLGLIIALLSVRRRGIGPNDRDDTACAI
ncbi:permease of the major facilitator superfamily [Aspergillus heteromorphus CBS 117.55]|uniref:Permease of the major facilitator superfamily n=1 Tax=Aspergillus heteromorphus CBS 117.55 TaxID=1448321 RepID=A0A317WF14_9EURO|nr:permease of the major facilitator superfamily [Aspergillus heteromorphus CBS 117.55]PWY84993.1 permease of the major facilitator superfamily [Aspergillus heteromorphus CBS 117.55]